MFNFLNFLRSSCSDNSVEFNLAEPQVRWLIRRDLEEVLNIECATFNSPWTEEIF